MKKITLIIITLFPSIIYSQSIEFDTTCFCSAIILKADAKGFYYVENFPEYPGYEIDSFKKFIESNTNFHKADNGKLLVYFTINCEGKTCGHNVKVFEGYFSEDSQQSVLMSLSKMQRWKPGRQRNKIVDVRFSRTFEVINGAMK